MSEKTTATPESGTNVSRKWEERFELFGKISADDSLIRKFFRTPGFKGLDSKEQKTIRWNGLALLFGPLYYFCKGMWRKGAVLLGVVWLFGVVLTLVELFSGESIPGLVYWLPSAFICGQLANFDYYRHIRHRDKAWSFLPTFLTTPKGIAAWLIVPFVLGVLLTPGEPGTSGENAASDPLGRLGEKVLSSIEEAWTDAPELKEVKLERVTLSYGGAWTDMGLEWRQRYDGTAHVSVLGKSVPLPIVLVSDIVETNGDDLDSLKAALRSAKECGSLEWSLLSPRDRGLGVVGRHFSGLGETGDCDPSLQIKHAHTMPIVVKPMQEDNRDHLKRVERSVIEFVHRVERVQQLRALEGAGEIPPYSDAKAQRFSDALERVASEEGEKRPQKDEFETDEQFRSRCADYTKRQEARELESLLKAGFGDPHFFRLKDIEGVVEGISYNAEKQRYEVCTSYRAKGMPGLDRNEDLNAAPVLEFLGASYDNLHHACQAKGYWDFHFPMPADQARALKNSLSTKDRPGDAIAADCIVALVLDRYSHKLVYRPVKLILRKK
ncbi:MAG: DUF2628 domain-containing protein [Lentisphaerae bacterium]|nr:DUF2628 domain-containing protein [Lentisphaerota bacterium]MBT7057063.1 DUF2628 domain-containing protein [Lentisphaerota bacterium]MBT7845535.1 DUF2628 domain-containing protein [Lentisphaerota bacterium]